MENHDQDAKHHGALNGHSLTNGLPGPSNGQASFIPGGYVIKARCIQESAIANASPCTREIFDLLVRLANHKDATSSGKRFNRGSLFTSYSEIRESLHWRVGYRKEVYSKDQCEAAMKWLTKEAMITKSKTTRGLIITICNYDYYQNPSNYEHRSENAMKTTRRPQPASTIYKNDKNDNKEEEGGRPPKPHDSLIDTRKKYSELLGTISAQDKKEIWNSIKPFIQENRPKIPEPYVDAWNLFASSYHLSEVKSINENRKNKIHVRLSDPAFDFVTVLEKIRSSPYLKGDNNRDWKVTFDWIIENDNNYLKVLEGNYN
jgi:hypothetical protein